MSARVAGNRSIGWKLTGLVMCAALALPACHRERMPRQLKGSWVGTVDIGDDLLFMRAEFASTREGNSGSAYLQGTGELTLVRSNMLSDGIAFEMKRGDEHFVFSGQVSRDEMIGHLNRGVVRMNLRLHRVVPVDHRLLHKYVGTYRLGSDGVRSIEDCGSELGWDQLVYVNHQNGARKLLFPISESSFFFGPGFLIPTPIEGTVTFIKEQNGRTGQLVWDEAGSTARIAERIDPDVEQHEVPIARNGASLCTPLPRLHAQAEREKPPLRSNGSLPQ